MLACVEFLEGQSTQRCDPNATLTWAGEQTSSSIAGLALTGCSLIAAVFC